MHYLVPIVLILCCGIRLYGGVAFVDDRSAPLLRTSEYCQAVITFKKEISGCAHELVQRICCIWSMSIATGM
jgi:hypothetical protein